MGLCHDRGTYQEPRVTTGSAFSKKTTSSCGISEWQIKQVPTSGVGNSIHWQPREWQWDETGLGSIQETGPETSYLRCFCQVPVLLWDHRTENGNVSNRARAGTRFLGLSWNGDVGEESWSQVRLHRWGPPGPDSNAVRKHSKTRCYKTTTHDHTLPLLT